MSGCAKASDRRPGTALGAFLGAAIALGWALAAGAEGGAERAQGRPDTAPAAAGRPDAASAAAGRVVSMNLCTDQLAMLIAAPGQIVSLSYLAADPRQSVMAEQAAAFAQNHGRAEEIYLLDPDLVLADQWSSPVTVAMLRRLGLRVEQFVPGSSVAEIRTNILRMGNVLGREAGAEDLLAAFDARLADLTLPADGATPRAAIYGPGGYAYGAVTLVGQILALGGLANIAGDHGLDYGGYLPLESLVMAAPDLVITGRPPEWSAARAEEIPAHPALSGLRPADAVTDAAWACATPYVLDAVARVQELRAEIAPEAGP